MDSSGDPSPALSPGACTSLQDWHLSRGAFKHGCSWGSVSLPCGERWPPMPRRRQLQGQPSGAGGRGIWAPDSGHQTLRPSWWGTRWPVSSVPASVQRLVYSQRFDAEDGQSQPTGAQAPEPRPLDPKERQGPTCSPNSGGGSSSSNSNSPTNSSCSQVTVDSRLICSHFSVSFLLFFVSSFVVYSSHQYLSGNCVLGTLAFANLHFCYRYFLKCLLFIELSGFKQCI